MTELASEPMWPADWLVSDELAPDGDDALLAPLYAAAGRGELALPFCASCDQPLELGTDVCDACRAERTEWRMVEPAGHVHSATVVHRREAGLILADHPYPVLDVELTSGHRLIMTTRSATDRAPAIGTPVAIGFRQVGGTHVPAADIGTTSEPTPEVRA
jgi:uncharacterized protein